MDFKAKDNGNNENDKFLINDFLRKSEKYTIIIVYAIFNESTDWHIPNKFNAKKFLFLYKKLDQIWKTKTKVNIDFHNSKMYQETGGGLFSTNTNTIHLYHPCVLTALHEWKHKLQQVYPYYNFDTNMEKDAIRWSHTIMKLALPDVYRQNLLSGKYPNAPEYLFPLKIFNSNKLIKIDELSNKILERFIQKNDLKNNGSKNNLKQENKYSEIAFFTHFNRKI